jgi:quercetin dioxygenase-like cupin family protein
VKACGSVTANVYTLIEVRIEPGGIMPSHRHAAFEEGIYVLDGSIRADHTLGPAARNPEYEG